MRYSSPAISRVFYCADPRTQADARPIDAVEALTPALFAMAGAAGSASGTGGMRTKLEAASKAGAAGIETFLFDGGNAETSVRWREGGCAAPASIRRAPAWRAQAWLRNAPLEPGGIFIDAGAVRALAEQGASLLAAASKPQRAISAAVT